jgi:hypothetical protein
VEPQDITQHSRPLSSAGSEPRRVAADRYGRLRPDVNRYLKDMARRYGLMLRKGASPPRIDSGLAGVRLVMTRGARALQRPNARGAATWVSPRTDGGGVGDPLTTQRFQGRKSRR